MIENGEKLKTPCNQISELDNKKSEKSCLKLSWKEMPSLEELNEKKRRRKKEARNLVLK